MLNREEVIQALDLHRRSYSLLLWLRTAISKGVIRFDRAHYYMDQAEAAADWIESHYLNLPANCRPEHEQLKPFAQFFATYLTISFELVKQPNEQLISSCGCYCPFCSYFAAGSHLKTKKLFRRDKERARRIKIRVLQQLSRENNTYLDQDQAEKLIDAQNIAANAALLAYGHQLVERTHGRSEGPAVLALWREIAWDKKGAPRKDFELAAEDIFRAEQSLVSALAQWSVASGDNT